METKGFMVPKLGTVKYFFCGLILAAATPSFADFTAKDFKKTAEEAIRLLQQVGNEPGKPSATRARLHLGNQLLDIDLMAKKLQAGKIVATTKPIEADGNKSAYTKGNSDIEFYPGDFDGKSVAEIRKLVLHELLRRTGLADVGYPYSTALGNLCEVQEEIELKGKPAGEELRTETGGSWGCETPKVNVACQYSQITNETDLHIRMAPGQRWYGPCYGRIPVCDPTKPPLPIANVVTAEQIAGLDLTVPGGESSTGGGEFEEQRFNEIGDDLVFKTLFMGGVGVNGALVYSHDIANAKKSVRLRVGKKGDKVNAGELLLIKGDFAGSVDEQEAKFLDLILPVIKAPNPKGSTRDAILAALALYKYSRNWMDVTCRNQYVEDCLGKFHVIRPDEVYNCREQKLYLGCSYSAPVAPKGQFQMNMNLGGFWAIPCDGRPIMCLNRDL